MERYQKKAIILDLKKKMVLLAGPRQAGKTTLANSIAQEFKSFIYLTYDRAEDRKILTKEAWLPSTELLIFDEIHKMPKWKNYLKGVASCNINSTKILTNICKMHIFHFYESKYWENSKRTGCI